MFHLFNRVYLEDERNYSSKYEYVTIYENAGKHPLSRTVDFPFEEIPSYQEFLQKNFNGSENLFWESLIKKSNKFIIYADKTFCEQILIRYWKSIFDDLSCSNAYFLHKLNYLDNRLKNFVSWGISYKTDSDVSRLMSMDEFEEKFNGASIIDPIAQMPKDLVSFEYLLGDYFYDSNSMYASAFEAKLEKLCWKIWFNEIEILRSELVNAFYDIKRVIPEANFDINEIDSVENFISNEPKLGWILDPDFHEGNIDYVKKNYNPELLANLMSGFREQWELINLAQDSDQLEKMKFQDDVIPTKYVFEGNFLKILLDNIDKKLGCRFVDSDLMDKANQLLPSFIYEKVRQKKTEELNFLKLRRGAY